MLPFIRERLDDLSILCRRHGVKSMSLFGSAASGEFRPGESDLDFLVEFLPMLPAERARHFFALEADLGALFGQAIDLAELDGIRNRRVRASVERHRMPLYAAA